MMSPRVSLDVRLLSLHQHCWAMLGHMVAPQWLAEPSVRATSFPHASPEPGHSATTVGRPEASCGSAGTQKRLSGRFGVQTLPMCCWSTFLLDAQPHDCLLASLERTFLPHSYDFMCRVLSRDLSRRSSRTLFLFVSRAKLACLYIATILCPEDFFAAVRLQAGVVYH